MRGWIREFYTFGFSGSPKERLSENFQVAFSCLVPQGVGWVGKPNILQLFVGLRLRLTQPTLCYKYFQVACLVYRLPENSQRALSQPNKHQIFKIRSPRPIPAAPVRTVSRIRPLGTVSRKLSSLSLVPVISIT